MKSKKLILILSFLMFLSFIYASPIIVEGYGETQEEATKNSLQRLSSYISTEVSSTTKSVVEVENDKTTTDTFSEDLILSSMSKLIGVQYNTKADVNGLKCVEAIIVDSESVQKQYIERINDTLSSIEQTNALLKDTTVDSDKLQYIEFIFNYLKDYKNYKFIMIHLNESWIGPKLNINETALKVEYLNLLDKQQKLLDDEIFNLQNTLTAIEQEQSDKLSQIIAKRNEINEEKEKALAQEQQWREGVIQSKTAQIIEKAESLKAKSDEAISINIASLIPNENPLIVVNQIEQKVSSYETSSNKMLSEIEKLRKQTEEDFFADNEKLSNRTLSIAEKSGGKETEQSKKHTQYLIDQSNESFFDQYKENRSILINALEDELSEEYDIILDNIDSLNDTDFVIDSFNDEINITIGQYNGSTNAWPIVLDFIILDKRIQMTFDLSYEDFTQSEIPQLKDSGEYTQEFIDYLEQVEVLEAYLADPNSNPISVKLQYTISSDKESIHDYYININKMIVIRNDNNARIIKANLSPTSIESFMYSPKEQTQLYTLKEKLAFQEKTLTQSNMFKIPEWNLEPFIITIQDLDGVRTYICDEDNLFTLPEGKQPPVEGHVFNCWYSPEVEKGVLSNQKIKATQYLTFYAYYSTDPLLFKYEGNVITGFINKNTNKVVMIPYFSPNNVAVKEIQSQAFKNSAVEKLIISDSVEKIGDEAFEDCKNLTNITLSDNLIEIGEEAFRSTNLSYVEIPNNVKKIGTFAFYNCTNLKTFIFGDGMESINRDIFASNPNYSNSVSIQQMKLPKNLKEIEDETFYSFRYLTNVEFGDKLVKIGDEAFAYTSLAKVNLPESVEIIGDSAFFHCNNLNSINFPTSLKTIGNAAFESTALTTVEMKNNVETIGDTAFEDCKNLTNITLSDNLIEIGEEAFRSTNLSYVEIPNNVKKIGTFAFYNCTNLKTFIFGDGMESINRDIFASNPNYSNSVSIQQMKLPKNLKEIEDETFYSFRYLTNVEFGDKLVKIGDEAFAYTSLAKVTLPESVEIIGDSAFFHCNNLNSINFPTSLKTIGDYAFADTNLNYIKVPSSVSNIGKKPFPWS